MLCYKGVFWYDPDRDLLITKKVECEEEEYNQKMDESIDYETEWAKFPQEITKGHPYNYYPHGRVGFENGEIIYYLPSVLFTPAIEKKINDEFGVALAFLVCYESEFLMNYTVKTCSMCGKTLDYYDHEADMRLGRHIGIYSKYEEGSVEVDLCVECFDKVLDWLLPQCVNHPITEHDS